MTRGRLWTVVAVVLIAIVGAGLLTYREQRQAQAEDRLCDQFQGNVAAAPTSVPGMIPAVIIGDSYTSGWELDDPADGYAPELATMLGWEARIDGFPGSGYTNATACGGQLIGDRVDDIPEGTAVTVIEAGLNDTENVDGVPSHARPAVREAVKRSAQVFVVGPPLAPVKDPAAIRQIDDTLRKAAEDGKATYISTLDWDLEYLDDGLHLTEAGHQAFAQQLAAAIG